MASTFLDDEILKKNNGRIVADDYVVISGASVDIQWTTKDVNSVNIFLEKTQNGVTSEKLIVGNIPSSPGITKKYSWLCAEQVDINYEYPLYRIKVVSSESNNIVSYSNQFKVSVHIPLSSIL